MSWEPSAGTASGEGAAAPELPRGSWARTSICVLLLASAFALLWPTTASLIVAWEDTDATTYTHGYLVVAISVWLLVRGRRRLSGLQATPALLACIPLAAASVLWLVGVRAGLQSAHQILFPVMVSLSIWAVFGRRVAMAGAFAIAYLYVGIPIWGVLTGPLQDATVVAVDVLLQVTGVPAYVEGNFVRLAAGTFEIVGGCSGLHFFIVAFAVGALQGEVNGAAWPVRLRIIALALLLAALANWLRVYCIIVAGYLTDMQHYLVRVEHYSFGWVVFAAMMVIFFLVVRRMPEGPNDPLAVAHGADGVPDRWPLAIVVALAAMSLGPLWNTLMPLSPARLPQDGQLLPRSALPWSGPHRQDETAWKPVFQGADREERAYYQGTTVRIDAYTAVYAQQAQNKEMVGYGNSLLGSEKARIIANAHIAPRGPVAEIVVEDEVSGARFVLWYFYRVGSLQTNRGLIAQTWYGASSVAAAPLSEVTALRAPCVPDCDAARSELQSLIVAAPF